MNTGNTATTGCCTRPHALLRHGEIGMRCTSACALQDRPPHVAAQHSGSLEQSAWGLAQHATLCMLTQTAEAAATAAAPRPHTSHFAHAQLAPGGHRREQTLKYPKDCRSASAAHCASLMRSWHSGLAQRGKRCGKPRKKLNPPQLPLRLDRALRVAHVQLALAVRKQGGRRLATNPPKPCYCRSGRRAVRSARAQLARAARQAP